MPQTERPARAASLKPSRLFLRGSRWHHVACEKFGETPDGAQACLAPPARPPALCARVTTACRRRHEANLPPQLASEKQGAGRPSVLTRKGEDGGLWSSVPLGESLPGLLGHKLKYDGWRVAGSSPRRGAGLIIQFRSLFGRWASLFFSSGLVYTQPPFALQERILLTTWSRYTNQQL